ncbi:MAG: PF13754 domain-containing protein [Lachnospiraceae bacterium]|jgi:hypothetical protein
MVARVYGHCNGREIIFTQQKETNIWSLSVPLAKDDWYVVDVYAEDEAGNISYATKYLYYFDSKSFKVIFLPYEWQCDLLEDEYSVNVLGGCYDAMCTDGTWRSTPCPDTGS